MSMNSGIPEKWADPRRQTHRDGMRSSRLVCAATARRLLAVGAFTLALTLTEVRHGAGVIGVHHRICPSRLPPLRGV